MKVLAVALFVMLACLTVLPVSAALLYVKADSPGPVFDGKSWDTAYHGVQECINAAYTGDEIWVAAGTYSEHITPKLGQSLYGGFAGIETARTQRNPRTNVTNIDGGGTGTVIITPAGATPAHVIDGFTIRNGALCGEMTLSCIFCSSSSPTISNNIISGTKNGIYCIANSNPIIKNNIIRDNSFGVYGAGGYLQISNNVITGNTAYGIWLSNARASIINNTIAANPASRIGTGLYISSSQTTISNNIIAFNGTGVYNSGTSPSPSNNCVFGNKNGTQAADYVGMIDPTGALGNIKVDPLLAYLPDDLHIQPNSPCRDTGNDSSILSNWLDMDGQSRKQGTHVDIGADESDGTQYLYVQRPVITPNGGVSTKSMVVNIVCPTSGAYMRYTTNGDDPTDADQLVPSEGSITVDHSLTLKVRAYKVGWNSSGVVSASFTITGKLPAPNFSVAPGSYNGAQYVNISCAVSGATISYTLDGTTPGTSGTMGSVLVRLGKGTVTLTAIARKYQWLDSDITTATYTIRGPAIVYVNSSAAGSVHDGASWDTAFTNVSDAAVSAVDGDEIWVAAGRYTNQSSSLYPDIALYGGFTGTEIERSQRDFRKNTTVLDNSVVKLSSTCTLGTKVDGFTLANGGQAVRCDGGSSGTISNCIISNHNAGAFYCDSTGTYRLYNNLWINNVGGEGTIDVHQGHVDVINNTFVGNTSSIGGAIDITYGSAWIYNSIIAYNLRGISRSASGGLSIMNSCVYGNSTGNYDIYRADPTGTNGVISADPKFVSLAYGDLRLQPDSPCKDTGNDSFVQPGWVDINNQPRIQGNQVDMGAYESDGIAYSFTPQIIRVGPSGDDANDGSSWDKPKRTVQSALNTLDYPGGEVWVQSGTYYEQVNLGLFKHLYGGFAGNETERSQRDWAHNETELDGGGTRPVVIADSCCSSATIDGFTIQNGKCDSSGNGGGMICHNASPTIANNKIINNTATYYGAGLFCSYCYSSITNNTIANNKGGGIDLEGDSRPVISANRIENNTSISGAGICCHNGSMAPLVVNNIIRGNNASSKGGALYLNFGGGSYINNVIVGNSAPDGGGVYLDSGGAMIANNIIAFNTSGAYGANLSKWQNNCVFGNTAYNYKYTDFTGQSGNTCADPLFVNWYGGNYNLLAGSPCIDAGANSLAPAVDYDGNQRPADGNRDGVSTADIGIYEELGYFINAASVKKLADGSEVNIVGMACTAVFADRLYVESDNGTSGIGIVGIECIPGLSATVGARITAKGTLTTVDGENVISVTSASVDNNSGNPIAPKYVNYSALGGGACGLQGAVQDYRLVKDPVTGKWTRQLYTFGGASNIGLLVKTVGRVTSRGANSFYLDGAAAFDDGDPALQGVKVAWPFDAILMPAEGSCVEITGISSCTLKNGIVVRLLRPVSANAVRILK